MKQARTTAPTRQDQASGPRSPTSSCTWGGARPGLLVDNHVHTRFSGHSPDGSDTVSLRWAGLHRGLQLSLREHAPLPQGFDLRQVGRPGPEFPPVSQAVGLRLDDHSLEAFFQEAAAAGLSIGFEVDILGGRLDLTEELVEILYRQAAALGVTIDALNCSHHIVGQTPWDATPETLHAAVCFCGGPIAFIHRYFADIREAAATGLFHCVSHLELPRKFDPGSGTGSDVGAAAQPDAGHGTLLGPPFSAAEEAWWDELERTLEALAVHGLALEYNTGGLATWGRPYLTSRALSLAVSLGLRMVVGSDAHHPDQVGRGFVDAERELRAAGVTEVFTFRAGKPIPVPLG